MLRLLEAGTTFEDACKHGALYVDEKSNPKEMIRLSARHIERLGYIPSGEVARTLAAIREEQTRC